MIGSIRLLLCALVVMGMVSLNAMAQSGTGGGSNLNRNYHISFERPEAWALKYFVSTSLLSGLQPPEMSEVHKTGSISVGIETDWIPALDEGQRQVGFNGRKVEDLNKTPILARPIVRIGLPGKFTAVAAAPPPFRVFGITPHLLAFGLERPILERKQWTLSWRGYGQVGSVKGAFSCPRSALGFAAGSPENRSGCVAESADVTTLRYAGSEFQFAYRPRRMPRLVPHAAVGGNFVDAAYHVNALRQIGLDRTREWTRGGTFSTSGGVSYLLTNRASITIDTFYSPLWVQRSPSGPRTNDGLFNVRAFLNYTFR